MTENLPDSFCVLGPTASGKTRLAVQLALQHDGEIISADSRQVYRELNLGVGKDLDAYTVDGRTVPVHLIGHVGLNEQYDLYRFQQECWACIDEIQKRGKTVIVCGGTGLYLDAVLRGYELPSRITGYVSEKRLFKAKVWGLLYPPDVLRDRIRHRLVNRLEQGMVSEVENLLKSGVSAERLMALGLEYKWITLFLSKEIGYSEMIEKLHHAICDFAKRQRTWFRRMERMGVKIEWIIAGSRE